jgi:3-deoxy-7-phosphoheptulonate synthase
MLLRLRRDRQQAQLDSILRLCKELGYRPRFLDARRELLELEGPGRPEHRSLFEDEVLVEAVLDAGDARELHEREPGRPDTVVKVGDARFGGGSVSLIAGPCAVEDEEHLLAIARAVRAAGATCLRGGAYKPRTSPYSFQGLAEAGLERLARVKAETGLAIVTEVLDPRDVEKVATVADVFQIGARSMANAPLLIEVGRAGLPVLLKRGFGARVRELLLASEYVLAQGNARVMLCERGVRGFDTFTRNLLDVGAVAHLKHATHLPVVVDPSHAAGRADLVPALARAGLAAGADGLLVEVHPEPDAAHSDGFQAVSPETFERIARDAEAVAALDGRRLARPRAPRAAESEPRVPV